MNESQAVVVAELAKGTPQRDIAALTGISQPTVCRINSRHKDLIESQSARIIDNTLTRIADRMIKEIRAARSLGSKALFDKDNQQALARIDKKEELILKSVGIAPSHAPSIHVQQIFNDNSKTLISPQVASLLGDKLDDIVEGEIIE